MDKNDFLPFSKPTLSDAAIAEVVDCLKSGWITTGPRAQKFEEILKAYLQAPHALALSTATAGLHLSLLGLNFKPGDEVIVPALTFVASLNTIVQAGARPVVVDIDPKTYNIDPQLLESAITPRTRAIMPVHFAGLSVELDAVYALAEKYQLRVIEDAAQAIGTCYKKQKIGSFGDTQIFSFHPNKNMTTGEGGCVTTRDEDLAKFVSAMRFHGIDRNAFNRFSKNGSQHYNVIGAGFKYNMMDMQAALGIHQIPELEGFNQKRKYLAQRYHRLLSEFEEWILPIDPDHPDAQGHAWHLYAPLLNTDLTEKRGITRDSFMEKMKLEHHIGIGLHYDPPYLYDFYQKKYGYKPGDFKHAEFVCSRIMSLPLFPLMTESDQDRVIQAMKNIFGRN